ncbi:hypothetical protein LCGC14_2070460 [marine sediment metagenome]|uniref:Uncharacterized protein n=1 Tax=marine sediment metagenome TaxID=412755 RepID=A0A0F9EIG7_9ZZZZ
MSDPTAIIVTVPKSQYDHVLNKKFKFKGAGVIWWGLPQLPRESTMLTSDGYVRLERCYFVWDGAVRAWHDIEDFIDSNGWAVEGPTRFAADDPIPGPAVVMISTHHRLREPVPMKSFQGFRYNEPKLEEGDEG